MTSQSLATVRTHALSLSGAERAELARDLLASLDGAADANVTEQWEAESIRRLGEIEAGTAKLVSQDELLDRMRQRLSGR